jgi:Phosphatidylserine/phosphatidylglycerophosphate/cardiolipin synthases and related enzymes
VQIRPKGKDLLFDTSEEAGKDPQGQPFTYSDEYAWLGFTARQRVFDILDEVAADKSLWLDVFAYDLNEPDVLRALLALAKQGRVRIILDNAALHHSKDGDKAEDQFEALFENAMKGDAGILRGKFGRYAHDKIFIVSTIKGAKKVRTAVKVLTGSTNLSVTGIYVNSNHVLVFDDPKVAAVYGKVFDTVWTQKASKKKFAADNLASQPFSFPSGVKFDVTFSPHGNTFTDTLLAGVVTRVEAERKKAKGSVLFAVMQLDKGTGPLLPALRALHQEQTVFSYGISDSPGGVVLYRPGTKGGLLVTGKPVNTQLPKPFSQVPGVGLGHQVHHKFIVCGFDRDDAVVYCGSSNLAAGGEENNGDNLLAIHDRDVATAFAIEALALVDHFNFLDRASSGSKKKAPEASKPQAAIDAGWYLSTDDKWAKPYFDADDLRYVDRRLFA